MFGNHGLGGLLEEGAHGKSPKCLGRNLGDFAKVSAFLFLNSVSDCTRDTGIDRLKY